MLDRCLGKVFDLIGQKFSQQLKSAGVSKKDVLAREKLHETAVLNTDWFEGRKVSDQRIVELIVDRLEYIASQNLDVAREIVETAASWSRFEPEAGQEIKKRSLNRLGIHS